MINKLIDNSYIYTIATIATYIRYLTKLVYETLQFFMICIRNVGCTNRVVYETSSTRQNRGRCMSDNMLDSELGYKTKPDLALQLLCESEIFSLLLLSAFSRGAITRCMSRISYEYKHRTRAGK